MNLTTNEIVAYIGAAAWAPQIVSWIYRLVTKPTITILPDKFVEIGYTSYGPIFNIRLALSSKRKDTIINQIYVHLVHQDGSRHTLSWAGMSESLSSLTDAIGNRQVAEKEYATIALKVTSSSLIERAFRFQEEQYHIKHNRMYLNTVNQKRYLESVSPFYREKLMESKEIHELKEFYSSHIWWKPGNYTATFEIRALESTLLKPQTYTFTFSKLDVDALHKNADVIIQGLENVVMAGSEGYTPHTTIWSWAYPQLLPVVV